MPATGCTEAMDLLNAVFTTALILNDGHEIRDRIGAGDGLIEILGELNEKFGKEDMAGEIRAISEAWPPLQLEAVSSMVGWALSKLDTDDRVTISWRGDAEYHETVTRFEVKGHELRIEFLHPPLAAAQAGAAGAAS